MTSHQRKGSGSFKPSVLAAAIALTVMPALSATAQENTGQAEAGSQAEQTYRFDIEAKPLPQAIADFSARTGIQVFYTEDSAFDHTAPALEGDYTAGDALRHLLAGTGLQMRFTGDNSITIEKLTQSAKGPTMLQAIEVLGRGERGDFAETTFAATKTETHVLDIPQTVNVTTKEVIEEQNLVQLNDVAPYVAGVNEFSVYDDLTIRGFRNSDDRRVNGLRVYNNFWSQPYIANVERVEVLKGPSAVLYGQASPGGVINIVTKKPLAERRHEIRGDIGTFGSGDNQGFVAFDTTGPVNESGSFLYRFNASTWDQDSFRTEVFDKGYQLAPSFSWIPGEDTRVNVDLNYTNRETVLDRGQPNLADADDLGIIPTDVSVTQPGDGLDFEDFTAAISLDQALSENWRLAAALQYHRYDEDLREHRVGGNLPSGSEYNVRYGERDTEAETLSGTIYTTGRFRTGPVAHKLVAGVDALQQENESRDQGANNVFVFDVLNPENIRRPVDSYDLETPSWSPWGEDNQRTGVFVQDQLTLGDWDLLAGLRYSRFTTEPLGGEENSDSDLAPRLGLVYRFTDSLSFYGTYAEGFEPNFGYTSEEGGPFDPTTSRLYEAGVKHLAFGGDLLMTAALYHIVNDDMVIWANNPNNPDLNRQRGQEQSTGLELEATGKVTENLSVIANYAYNDAEVTEDELAENEGKTKEGAPRHAATLWGKYQLGGGFAVGAGAEYVGDRKTFEDGFDLPDYTLYNAGVFYKTGGLDMSLIGKNLTDEEHWTGGYYPGRVYPGNPLQVTLSARYAF